MDTELTVEMVARMVRDLTPEQRARVVHCKRAEYDIYIGDAVPSQGYPRPSGWHNPYHCSSADKADPEKVKESVRKYTAYVLELLRTGELTQDMLESTLGGKRLGCWCRTPGTDKLCHGLVLVAFVDSFCSLAPRRSTTGLLRPR